MAPQITGVRRSGSIILGCFAVVASPFSPLQAFKPPTALRDPLRCLTLRAYAAGHRRSLQQQHALAPALAAAHSRLLEACSPRSRRIVSQAVATPTAEVEEKPVTPEPSREEVLEKMEDMLTESSALPRYFRDNPEAKEEFFNLEVFSERQSFFFHATETPFPMMTSMIQERYSLDHVEVMYRQVSTGELLVMIVVDVDAGVVASLGLSDNFVRSRDLAAQNLLTRVLWPKIVQAEMDWTFKRLAHFPLKGTPEAGAPAKLASEALEAFSRHLRELKLNIICPFGFGWRASIYGTFQGKFLRGVSRNHTGMNEVVGECGEDFYYQMRDVLGIDPNATHNPKAWCKIN